MPYGPYDLDLLSYVNWARTIRGLSDNTIRVRLDFLHRLHIYLGIPLRDAQAGHLLAFERVAIAGRAPQSRRAYVSHLKAFYKWAIKSGIVSEDPTALLTVPVMPRTLPRPIEEDDLAVALNAARPKMRAILTLAAFAGLRAVEISGLSWDDLRREIDGTAFLLINGKGKRQRRVAIGETVVKALQAYGIKRRGPMFHGADAQRQEAKSISCSANRFLARQGLEVTLHQLRHRYGTVCYELSRDLRVVQELLGHASPNTTAGYTRPSAEAATRLVRRLDDTAPVPTISRGG